MNIEEKINYKFKNEKLISTALTHSSYAHENNLSEYNERLEFLGDAILELISSEYIFKTYNNLSEGEMTKARAYAVCEESLSEIANRYGFSDFLLVGKCENKVDGKYRSSILADSVEAVIGAIYLDSGFESAKNFILPNLINKFEEFITEGNKDYKTQLQEILQEVGDRKIEYKIIDTIGPEHDKIFEAEVFCDGKSLGKGRGKNKKEAEMYAAKNAMANLK